MIIYALVNIFINFCDIIKISSGFIKNINKSDEYFGFFN